MTELTMTKGYTYEQYLALYEALNGYTTHFVPGIGTQEWHKAKLSRQDFEQKLALLYEILSHDDDWILANYPCYYIDESESEAWESLELRSELFVIEFEKSKKIVKALVGTEKAA